MFEIRDPDSSAVVTGQRAMLLFCYNSRHPDKIVVQNLNSKRRFRVHSTDDKLLLEPLGKRINLVRRRSF